MKKVLPRNRSLRALSTQLRNQATPQEKELWYRYLRTYPVRFNRQRIIGDYIVDFYCSAAALVVELDGSQHFEADAIKHDAARTAYLERLGLKVLRFSNLDVDRHFDAVCQMIDTSVAARMAAGGL